MLSPEEVGKRFDELKVLDLEMVQYFNDDLNTIWTSDEATTFFTWVFDAVQYQGMNPKDILKAVASKETTSLVKFNSEIGVLIGAFLD